MRIHIFIFPVFAFLLALPVFSAPKVRLELPALISDHMVLQSGLAEIWGKEQPGRKILVSMDGKTASGLADAQGRWTAHFNGLEPGGPYDLVVQGSESVTIHDVLVGEVWVGSGQSNMEFAMREGRNAKHEIAKADDGQLRLFTQGRAMGLQPLEKPKGRWMVCTPETVKDFSAVAYFFGRDLRKSLKVPVGMIAASWGGSYIESWIPEGTLRKMPETQGLLKAWKATSPAQRKVWSQGVEPSLMLSEVRFMPKDPSQQPLTVLLAPGSQDDPQALGGVWTGEAKEGSTSVYETLKEKGPRQGTVGRFSGHFEGGAWAFVSTKFKSDNRPVDLNAYRSLEFFAKGNGEFFIFLPQPSIRDSCYWSSQPFKITRRWKNYRIDLAKLKHDNWGKPAPFTQGAVQRLAFGALLPALSSIPSVLYNGMISPLTPYRIRGVIWYQGEANEWDAEPYRRLLPSMIRSWRGAWKEGDFPFLIAQLPDFKDRIAEPSDGNWPVIREGQALAARLPQVDYAVLLGLGDSTDIHPKNKRDVGKRLALTALHTAYGQAVDFCGPRFQSISVEGNKIRVHYQYAEKGLKAKGGRLRGFAVAGPDGKFKWAEAKIDGSTVLVWNNSIPAPKNVRYAWADNPDANLYGKDGFPAAPFRTDGPQKTTKP